MAKHAPSGAAHVDTDKLTERIGPFMFEPKLLSFKQECLLRDMAKFYTEDKLRTMLIPMIRTEDQAGGAAPADATTAPPSLRSIDWLVTNYAKVKRIVYTVKRGGVNTSFGIYEQYTTWLRHFRRRLFDMFRRYERVYFEMDGELFATTPGQLNFMYFADVHNVLEYARTNIVDIEEHMAACAKKSAQEKRKRKAEGKPKKRRRELNKGPDTKCLVYNMTYVVSFDDDDDDGDGAAEKPGDGVEAMVESTAP